jgi:hypothetical protein
MVVAKPVVVVFIGERFELREAGETGSQRARGLGSGREAAQLWARVWPSTACGLGRHRAQFQVEERRHDEAPVLHTTHSSPHSSSLPHSIESKLLSFSREVWRSSVAVGQRSSATAAWHGLGGGQRRLRNFPSLHVKAAIAGVSMTLICLGKQISVASLTSVAL